MRREQNKCTLAIKQLCRIVPSISAGIGIGSFLRWLEDAYMPLPQSDDMLFWILPLQSSLACMGAVLIDQLLQSLIAKKWPASQRAVLMQLRDITIQFDDEGDLLRRRAELNRKRNCSWCFRQSLRYGIPILAGVALGFVVRMIDDGTDPSKYSEIKSSHSALHYGFASFFAITSRRVIDWGLEKCWTVSRQPTQIVR